DAEFARAFRQEWLQSGADGLTAGDHFAGMETAVQWLDAIAVVQTLWPGLGLGRAFGRLPFTLGAWPAVRGGGLAGAGGGAGWRDDVGEGHRLGARVGAVGKTVRLSKAVLARGSEPMGWREYWRHQLRVAVTYRVVAPAGAAGMILTRGFALSFVIAT